jgi:hypothetical protein
LLIELVQIANKWDLKQKKKKAQRGIAVVFSADIYPFLSFFLLGVG